MSTGKHRRSLLRSAAGALALVVTIGAGVLLAPAPARADTVRGLQWYLDTLKISQAHKLSRGKGAVVAVVDSGVYAAHPDLKGQVLPGKSLGPGVPADGRGDPDQTAGHGTMMAGVIAGRGGGSMHLLGIAPDAKVLPVGLGAGRGDRDIAGGIRWAADHGADVINLSVGEGLTAYPDTLEAVRYAFSKDAVVVAAVGNVGQGARGVQSPASIPGVIAVGGTDRRGGFWSGSTFGPETVLSAPAEQIISTTPPGVSSNGYGVSDGTSLATALVSGVAALVRARYPDLDAANVVNRLIRTARDAGSPGRDSDFGFGLVDPVAALTRSVPTVTENPLVADAAPEPSAAADKGGAQTDDEPMVTFGLAKGVGPIIQTVICLLAVVGLVVALFLVSRRRRRAARTPPGPQFGPGQVPPGYGPPPGHAPPPGYGPPPGYPPPPGYGTAQPPNAGAPSFGPPPGYPPAQPYSYPPRPQGQPNAPQQAAPPTGPDQR
ncbi:type VII secretion-associated serine protease mycosin [Micromonospora sp. NPDC006766]|uniref:type VII secretion-associated serine protease mycosin n=1 Tax=Micromonospora sp. NPDC006766 TaxID=3154778 RepID=UPI0033DD10E7